MAHFAKLDENNIVEIVVVIDNKVIEYAESIEKEQLGIDFLKRLYGNNTNWKQTSYNHKFRGRMAAIGYLYDENLDIFIRKKPYPSWTYDSSTKDWVAPKPYPNEGLHDWNEELMDWILIGN